MRLRLCDKCISLRWRHNGLDSVSNHQPPGCLLNRLFRRKSKKTSKLRVTGLCAGNSPGTGEFSAQMASYAENVSIWWRHHVKCASITSVWYYQQRRKHPNQQYRQTYDINHTKSKNPEDYPLVSWCAVRGRNKAVIFPNPHNRHPIARPRGRGMRCPFFN